MSAKLITIILSAFILLTSLGIQPVHGQTDEQSAKIRAKVQKYGTNKKVLVTLTSGAQFKGKIVNISQDSFDVAVKDVGDKTVSFNDVSKIKSASSKKAWIIVAAAAGGGLAIWLLTAGRACRNEGANVFCR